MTYVIGEIGQNHNGSLDIAKLIIDIAARPVFDKLFNKELRTMDAVKFTKRDLSRELTNTEMNRTYDSPNSFGKTYGDHRAFLEFSDAQHFELFKYAKSKNLDFIETICAESCLKMFKLFEPDQIKIASRDLTNLPLIDALAETKIPIIISTGMANEKELDTAVKIISRKNSNLSILHCVSEYPTKYENVNLRTISYLKKKYHDFKIGYSDHTIGIVTPIAAVAMGAEIIEKHITIDRQMKGTDQLGSLGIDGINRMMRDIRNLDLSLGTEKIFISKASLKTKKKLERSIATKRALKTGHVVTIEDIHLLSPGDGIQWINKEEVLGRKLKTSLLENEIIYKENLM